MKITIYTKRYCHNCLKAARLLEQYNPRIIIVGEDIHRDDFFSLFPQAKTLPQIIINGNHIGGYYDLEKWMTFENVAENF